MARAVPSWPGPGDPRRAGLLLAAAVLVCDQLSKRWLLPHLAGGRVIELLPVLDFRLVWNTGISMGLLQDAGAWLNGAIAAVTLMVAVWLWRARASLEALALGAILGGAVGNLVDRLRFGAVMDFVHVHVGSWSFYVFNLADAALTLGAVALALALIRPDPAESIEEGGRRL